MAAGLVPGPAELEAGGAGAFSGSGAPSSEQAAIANTESKATPVPALAATSDIERLPTS
jgi:hypothetical protein